MHTNSPARSAGAPALAVTVFGALLAAWAGTASADVAIDPALLTAREAAWRAWFAGDAPALTALLPPEFIGIAWNDTPFASRDETIAASKAFRDGGGRLVRLAFPETRAQRFGDVVVLYGRFEAVLVAGGAEQTIRGRLTETFIRRGGRWLHPGWHLDATSSPSAATP